MEERERYKGGEMDREGEEMKRGKSSEKGRGEGEGEKVMRGGENEGGEDVNC